MSRSSRVAQARELGGTALDDPLVRDVRTDDHVAADEIGAGDAGDGQRLQARVAQDVHADLQSAGLADLAHDHAHRGDGDGLDLLAKERGVTDVLDDRAIEARPFQDRRFRERELDHGVEVHRRARRPRQRRQVDHPDERLRAEERLHVGHGGRIRLGA